MTTDLTTTLTICPEMERPHIHEEITIPLFEGWHTTMRRLLRGWEIYDESTTPRRMRRTKSKRLTAKECSPGFLAYRLDEGDRRGREGAERRNEWLWLPLDLDAVPLPVDSVLDIVRMAFAGTRLAAWTTWSCRDGYASVRVLFPLSRAVKYEILCPLFWWARRRLLDAGLPHVSAKVDGSPSVDSRLDTRLFFLPAVPSSRVPGTEGWGGVLPCGLVSPDEDALLDVDSLLDEARNIEAADKDVHLERWPNVPVPGGRRAMAAIRRSSSGYRVGDGGSRRVYLDFSTFPMHGTGYNVREWGERFLRPGGEEPCGSLFKAGIWAPGDNALAYKTAHLRRREDGSLWLRDWTDDTNYYDDRFEVVDPTDIDDLLGDEESDSPVEAEREQDARDHAEHERRRDALSVYEERILKKKAKAETLDEVVVRGAQAAMEVARRLSPRFRAHLEAQGLPRPDPRRRCGFALGTQNAITGQAGSYRLPCGTRSCSSCAPVVIAERIGAILHMPVQQKGEVRGQPLSERHLWVYSIDEAEFDSFRQRWLRARVANPLKNTSDVTYRGFATEGADAYVAFHLVGGRVVFLSTRGVPNVDAEDEVAPGTVTCGGEDKLTALLVRLAEKTYGVVLGGEGVPPIVVGKISSSQGITLDPAEICKLATKSPWISAGKVNPARLRAAFRERGVETRVQNRTYNTIGSVTSVGYVEPAVALAAFTAAAEKPDGPVGLHIDPGLADLFEDERGEPTPATPTFEHRYIEPDMEHLLDDILNDPA
ncbi:MAG: hypothetical protein ACOZNI_30125 [Myxococcota bacterium]